MTAEDSILVLYPWPGLPATDRGSALRLVPLLRLLASQGYRVTVLSPGNQNGSVKEGGIDYVRWSPSCWERIAGDFLWRIYDGLTYHATKRSTSPRQRRQWWHYIDAGLKPSLRRKISELAKNSRVILLEYAFWSALLPKDRPPVLLTLHDVLSEMLPEGFLRRRVWNREVSAARSADAVVCVSRDDQAALRRGGIDAVFAPHAFESARDMPSSYLVTPALEHIRKHRAVGGKIGFFVGSSLQPNVDAVAVLQRIAQRTQDGWLVVAAGSCCGAQSAADGFYSLGPVSEEELQSLYQECDVFISPVESGTGVSTKILEAMSHGKPVLATPCAVRGYNLQAGRDYIQCASEDEFTTALHCVADDPAMATALAEAGRDFAANFAPEKAYAPYLALVRQLMVKRR
jgi:glycosyltransferase involved in cell wall biosynthesis